MLLILGSVVLLTASDPGLTLTHPLLRLVISYPQLDIDSQFYTKHIKVSELHLYMPRE